MDYICKRKNNIQSISITPDCTSPWDRDGSQPEAPPLSLKGLPGRPASLHPVWIGEPSLRLKAGMSAAQHLRHAYSALTRTQISSECVPYRVVVYTCVYKSGARESGMRSNHAVYGYLKSWNGICNSYYGSIISRKCRAGQDCKNSLYDRWLGEWGCKIKGSGNVSQKGKS